MLVESLSYPETIVSKQSVDPEVSKIKFENELSKFRTVESFNRQRGVILIRAEFPNIVISFTAFRIRPLITAFTVKINFTNYDLEPPSIQFVDTLTEDPLTVDQLCHRMPRLNGNITVTLPNGQEIIQPNLSYVVQAHEPNNIPFLCIPGVREYHNHPAHSNDPWLAHRNLGEGTLGFIIDQLYKFGSNPISEVTPQVCNIIPGIPGSIQVQFKGLSFSLDPNLISS